jgi:hypothetical protein
LAFFFGEAGAEDGAAEIGVKDFKDAQESIGLVFFAGAAEGDRKLQLGPVPHWRFLAQAGN